MEILKNGNWFLAAYLVSGFTNCIGMSLMSDAMQKGPNGIVWTIIQSAMIYPFAIGIIFFDVHGSLIRYCGMAVILTALLLFGLGKDNKVSTATSGNWKLPAFLGWLVIGIQQNMHVLPSYFEAGRAIPPAARAIFTSLGAIVCALLMMCFIRQQRAPVQESFANKYFWIFVFGLQSVGLTVTYLLQFPGIDIMAKHGLGNASYPVMVSSCLIAFFMYSTIFLREKVRPISIAALLCCLAGIVMICL
jgi:drug/metabolite transporter (DMT)-like permease